MTVATAAWGEDDSGRLPDYDLLEKFAQDGLGVFYRARQRSLDRIVTLYTVGTVPEAEALRCMTREGDILASMRHPYVVQIHDRVQLQGRHYLVLEAVDGGSLEQRIRGTAHACKPSAGLVERLARTMAYVHERGVVHCDLKPRKILLTVPPVVNNASNPGTADYEEVFGVPKIAGFELALRDGEATDLAEGTIRGTPAYMTPEQAQGRLLDIGPATDTHALGAILYELLTGRPPFRGETVLHTLKQAIESTPESPRKLNPQVDRELEAICLRCLHKSISLRYSNGLELASALRAYRERASTRRWFR